MLDSKICDSPRRREVAKNLDFAAKRLVKKSQSQSHSNHSNTSWIRILCFFYPPESTRCKFTKRQSLSCSLFNNNCCFRICWSLMTYFCYLATRKCMFLLHALILGTLYFLGSVLVDSFKIVFSSLSSSLRGIVIVLVFT